MKYCICNSVFLQKCARQDIQVHHMRLAHEFSQKQILGLVYFSLEGLLHTRQ